jgi:hypothetical protein
MEKKMALKLLQPGMEPLGQFDLEDDDQSLVVGGEVGVFQALNVATDLYAADAFTVGPTIHVTLSSVTNDGELYGLVDEGVAGYGTAFGTLIGGIVGKGTGFGASSASGVVTIGPSTVYGSGKVTLWTKPGLYGVTADGFISSAQFGAATLNTDIFGTTADGTNDGKLTSSSAGQQVALFLGRMADTSLVSTTNAAAGGTAQVDYAAIYLLGVQK